MTDSPSKDARRTALEVVAWVRRQKIKDPNAHAYWDDVVGNLEHELVGSGVSESDDHEG